MNLNQIQRRLQQIRDDEVKAEVAARFERDADRKSLAGNFEDGAELRAAAKWLRSAGRAEARRFLGTVYNAMQEDGHAAKR